MDPLLQLHTTQEIQVRVQHLHSTLGKMDIWRHLHLHSTYRKRDKISLLHLHSLFWKSIKSTRYIYILHIENWTFPPSESICPYIPVPGTIFMGASLNLWSSQVKSSSGATRPRGDHPDPDLSSPHPFTRALLWRGLWVAVWTGYSGTVETQIGIPHRR